jgi:beta-glucanase (GH16 family)
VRTRVTLGFSPAQPIVSESFAAVGRVSTRFKRPVALRVQVGPAWRVVRRATTTRTGVYRLAGLATATPRRYSVLVPAVRRSGRVYSAATTPGRRVAPVRQSGTLDVLPAVSQRGAGPASSGAARGSVVARFAPARPGRAVTFFAQRADGSWARAGRATRQGADGTAYLFPSSGSTAYQATTAARYGAPAVTTAAAANTYVPTFHDEFSGSTLNTSLWTYREGRAPSRTHSKNDARAVSVGGGTVRLQVMKDPAAPSRRYLNGQISTEGRYSLTYGVASARVRFQVGRGQHGSFWLQSPTYGSHPGRADLSGAEIDVAEFFGRGYPQGGLASFNYYVDRNRRNVKTGGVWPGAARLIPARDTWWNSYHVFSVKWTPRSYTFYVDGRILFSTGRGVSKVDEYLVLSLLTSDWELPKLDRRRLPSTMQVDWVRAWQTG